jgi:hypothetical protein
VTEQPAEPQAHGVHIEAQPGSATIAIDGNTLPRGQVTGYTLHHSIADSLPALVLHTRQPDDTVWDGFARVAVADPQQDDAAGTIAAFLDAVDPAALENAALNRDDLGNSKYDLTRAMLRQLADWARGEG